MSILYTTFDNKDNKNSGIVHNGGNKYTENVTVDVLNGPINTVLFQTGPIDGINTTTSKFDAVFAKNTQRGLIKTVANSNLEEEVLTVIKTPANTNITNIRMIHDRSSTVSRLESTAYRGGKYQFYTGKYDVGYPDTQFDSFNLDSAVTDNRQDQGKIFFKNSKDITIQSYQPKLG